MSLPLLIAQAIAKAKKVQFDPEGTGYDYDSATKYGIEPSIQGDKKPHWQSRVPSTGLLLKGKKHETWDLLEQGEREAGYEIYKQEDGRYYSRPRKKSTAMEFLLKLLEKK